MKAFAWFLAGLSVLSALAGLAELDAQRSPAPSGPPKLYLRYSDPRWFCAPNHQHGGYSCVDVALVIKKILDDPPECGDGLR